MTAPEFEIEIKKLDERFSISDNPNRPGLTNIFFMGRNYDLPAISTNDIRVEVEPAYQYEFPNGLRVRFWTQDEVKDRLVGFLQAFKDGKYDGLYD